MGNRQVQLWAPPSAQLLLTCIWRTWKPRPYSLHRIHHHFLRRFVDDTLTIMKSSQIESFLQHLNSIDHHIQFTKEDSRPDGSMPFLDILITPRQDGSLKTTVYRKPTLTDLYLQWDSNHTITSKYSVVDTLHHRAQVICSSPELLQ